MILLFHLVLTSTILTQVKILQIVHTLVPAVSMLKITIYSIEIYLFVLSRPLQVAGRTRFFKIIIFFLTEHSVELQCQSQEQLNRWTHDCPTSSPGYRRDTTFSGRVRPSCSSCPTTCLYTLLSRWCMRITRSVSCSQEQLCARLYRRVII